MSVEQAAAETANLATAISLILGVYIFYRSMRREQIDREYGTYDALDNKYIEYLKLCIEYPEIDIYNYPIEGAGKFDQKTQVRRQAAFEILISILERSYLMYSDQSSEIKRRQWSGWSAYIDSWAGDRRFADMWSELGYQFDSEFCKYISQRISTLRQVASTPVTLSAKA